MHQNRLSNLTVLAMENELVRKINLNAVLQVFAQKKARISLHNNSCGMYQLANSCVSCVRPFFFYILYNQHTINMYHFYYIETTIIFFNSQQTIFYNARKHIFVFNFFVTTTTMMMMMMMNKEYKVERGGQKNVFECQWKSDICSFCLGRQTPKWLAPALIPWTKTRNNRF